MFRLKQPFKNLTTEDAEKAQRNTEKKNYKLLKLCVLRVFPLCSLW